VQHLEELAGVLEVQPRRRLVEDIEGAAGRAPGQLLGELDALRLAARQCRRLLADLDVAEADRISVVIFSRIAGTAEKNASASSTVMSRTSDMLLPLKRTSSVSRL
jgi:hypothetical protein